MASPRSKRALDSFRWLGQSFLFLEGGERLVSALSALALETQGKKPLRGKVAGCPYEHLQKMKITRAILRFMRVCSYVPRMIKSPVFMDRAFLIPLIRES